MKEPINYAKAQEELKEILTALETPSTDLENLTQKVERAKFLIDWARKRLRSTEERLTGLFEDQS